MGLGAGSAPDMGHVFASREAKRKEKAGTQKNMKRLREYAELVGPVAAVVLKEVGGDPAQLPQTVTAVLEQLQLFPEKKKTEKKKRKAHSSGEKSEKKPKKSRKRKAKSSPKSSARPKATKPKKKQENGCARETHQRPATDHRRSVRSIVNDAGERRSP